MNTYGFANVPISCCPSARTRVALSGSAFSPQRKWRARMTATSLTSSTAHDVNTLERYEPGSEHKARNRNQKMLIIALLYIDWINKLMFSGMVNISCNRSQITLKYLYCTSPLSGKSWTLKHVLITTCFDSVKHFSLQQLNCWKLSNQIQYS